MSAPVDSWVELNQGGRLLDRRGLELLPEPCAPPWNLADKIRDALVDTPAGRPTKGEELSELLDAVLEVACGLKDGWRKGPNVGSSDAEKLLDGTVLKPRRVLSLADQIVLPVFVTQAERVGLHGGHRGGRRVVAQVVEYLRRRRVSLGLVTNGQEWRLIFADTGNLAWVEWAADRWLEGDAVSSTLVLLRWVLSPVALTPTDAGTSPLLLAIRHTRRGQARLSKELGERVRSAVEVLLRARRPVLEPTWDESQSKSVYDAACHFVMRMVVVLFAEARELLPVDSPIYHHAYGLRGLLEGLERAGADRRRSRISAWPRLIALFRLLHQGSEHPQLIVTAYGGDLFRAGTQDGDPIQQALALLEAVAEPPNDETIYKILVLLTRTTERVREGSAFRTVAAPVDFTELTSEYIGILYEGLLDYELHRVSGEPIVFLGLGDEPALPLDRLEAMADKQLAALVEKAKVKREVKSESDEGGDDESESDDGAEEASADEAAGTSDEDLLPPKEATSIDELEFDDERAKARRRAVAWAERAALAGKLVRAPRGKKGKDDPAWRAEVERAANQLISDVKLPGELYLVRWGGTRKGAGTFYTRPQLTLPTVRRTLEPLLIDPDGRIRAPEQLLALKVCDPAMGSGSFLVAALRVLTEAVVRSLHEHGRITRRDGGGTDDLVRLQCEVFPDADCDQPEHHVEAIVRRTVVEHCLYGVDLDPLAVELARVSLWVETLDRRLPFTFLDHKLRCGNALIGTWLNRFRDYPLLAWWRQSSDERWQGVTHNADVWSGALKDKRKTDAAEQMDLLTGQKNLLTAAVSDDELKAAIARVRELYRRLRKVPASQPDKRAEIWRKQVAVDPAIARVREAFDTWCALWFWPLDKVDVAPGPAALLAPSEEARAIVRALRIKKRFFHWELEFPDVFTEPGAGFSAVVGNPPWETKKPKSQEFFSNYDPLFRGYSKQEALARQRELFVSSPQIEETWLEYIAGFKEEGNFVRNTAEPFGESKDDKGRPQIAFVARDATASVHLHERWNAQRIKRTGCSDPLHPFRHQGSADLNTYKLFAEMAYRLLTARGALGLIIPGALLSDHGSRGLRELLVFDSEIDLAYVFQNEKKIFKDIDHRSKQLILVARRPDVDRPNSAQELPLLYRLGIGNSPEADEVPTDLERTRELIRVPRGVLTKFSPKSLSVLEIQSERDLDVLTRMYSNSVLLGDEGPEGWGITYAREFDMTNDSNLFLPRDKAEATGCSSDEYGRWIGLKGECLLPLYEGRMIGQFDFSQKGWVSGKGRTAVWREIPWEQKVVEPQFLMSQSDYVNATDRDGNPKAIRGLKLGFMDVGSATNTRTMIAGMTFDCPHGNKVPVLAVRNISGPKSAENLCGILGTFSYDFAMRARLGGLTLNYFIIAETPLPTISKLLGDRLRALAFALGAAHKRFAPAWLASRTHLPIHKGWRGLWAITPNERIRLRCMLDVIIAAYYGLTREDLRWILRDCDHPREHLANKAFCRTLDSKGFWRVDRDEDPELRHSVLTLVALDALGKLVGGLGGDLNAGIRAFTELNSGEGWMLPETLRLADYDLGHDERAKQHQPVASRLGPRFLDWQLAQTPEESWAECERHARAILGEEEFERRFGAGRAEVVAPSQPEPTANGRAGAKKKPDPQMKLF